MKVISKDEILANAGKTKKDGFCTKCNKDAVKKAVSEVKEFDAIPIDRIKQAREEIQNYKHGNGNMFTCGLNKAVEILDKLIENEGE